MDLDYSILNIDFYRLQINEIKELAQNYQIKFNPLPDQFTVAELREKLASLKWNFKRANSDNNYEKLVQDVYLNRILSTEIAVKYPQLKELLDNLLPLYDNVYESVLNKSFRELLSKEENPNNQIYSNVKNHDYQEIEFNQNLNKVAVTPLTVQVNTKPEDNFQTKDNTDNLPFTRTQPELRLNMEEQLPLIKAKTFSAQGSENATEFIDNYELVSKCNRWRDETKITLFATHLTGTPYKWFQIFKADRGENITWQILKENFLKVFSPLALIDDALTVLQNRTQKENENTQQFVFEIIYLCNLVDKDMTESHKVNYIVQAVRPEICEELIKLDNTSLTELQDNISKIEKQLLFKSKNLRKFQNLEKPMFSLTNSSNSFTSNANSSQNILDQSYGLQSQISELRNTLANLNLASTDVRNKVRFSRHNSVERRESSRERSKSPYYKRHDRYNNQSNNHRSLSPYDRSRERYTSNYNEKHYRDASRDKSQDRYFSDKRREESRDSRANSRGDRFCHICQMSNHWTKECGFNLKSLKNNHPSLSSNSRRKKYCTYCKNTSHNLAECFKNHSKTPKQPSKNELGGKHTA